MKHFSQNYVINYKKFKFYNENPEDGHTERWEKLKRLAPKKFMERYDIKDIDQSDKLIPRSTNPIRKICSGMSKLSVDCTFNQNTDCILTVEILKTFKDKEFSEQLSSIFEKFQNTQERVTWPYDTEDKTVTNLLPVDVVLEYGKPIERVRKTMFITPASLYSFVANMEEAFDIFIVEHFPRDEIMCLFDGKIKISYKFEENYGQSERKFLKKVVEKWIELKPEKVVFKNVLFLTHFSVSVLRIIASFYKFLSVNVHGIVELEQFKPELLKLKLMKELQEQLNGSSCHYIMWFAEQRHVNKGDFFEIITNYNSQLIMQYILKAFDFLITKNL